MKSNADNESNTMSSTFSFETPSFSASGFQSLPHVDSVIDRGLSMSGDHVMDLVVNQKLPCNAQFKEGLKLYHVLVKEFGFGELDFGKPDARYFTGFVRVVWDGE